MEEIFLRIAQKHIQAHYLAHLRTYKSQTAQNVAAYLDSADAGKRIRMMACGKYVPVPRLGFAAKAGQGKRSVYIYSFEDASIMGLMYYALRQHKGSFIEHACSSPGQKGYFGFLEAVEKHFAGKYFACIDIKHFFDSIPEVQVVKTIEQFFEEDITFAAFLKSLCQERRYYTDDGLRYDAPAVKAGSALSNFLANLYLNDVDHIMTQVPNTVYLRYIDSVIILAAEKEALQDQLELYRRLLAGKGLEVHADKTRMGAPGEQLHLGDFVLQSKDKTLLTQDLSGLRKFLRRQAKIDAMPQNINYAEALRHIRSLLAKVNAFNQKYFGYHIYHSHKNILAQVQNMEMEYIRRAIAGNGVHARYSWSYKRLVKLGFRPLV